MKTVLTLLFCAAATSLFAQNTITGKVMDEENNTIPFATVYLPQIEKGTTADADGSFVLTNVANGNFKVVISSIGYETKSMVVKIPTDIPLEITLNTSAIEMEEVIVSTPFHNLQSENVMKVERKSLAEINSQGALTLSDGLSKISGVENVSTGVSIGKPVIRGLSSNRVLVYVQGTRLENQQFGDEHGLGVNATGIESVEVIKGPSTLLYGSDALGGVIYLNPERFAAPNEIEGSVEGNYFSNTNGFSTSAGVKGSSDHFKWLVRGSLAQHSDYDTDLYRVTNTRFKEEDIKLGFGYQRNQFKTEVRYNYFQTELGLPEEIGEQSTDKTPLVPYQDIQNHIFTSKSTIFFDNSSLDATFGYIYNGRKEFEDHEHEEEGIEDGELLEEEEEGPALIMKLKTFNFDLKYHLPTMGRFETIVGTQGMHQTNANFGEEILIPDATTIDYGFLATSHVHFDTFDIQFGARLDNRKLDVDNGISRDFHSLNGAAGIKGSLFKILTARLNVASGFRAPNLAELTSDGTHEGTNRYEIGNADLENEQNVQVDLSLEYQNEHIEVFGNAFYNGISNYIFLNPNGDFVENDPVFLYEQDAARLYGGEFGFHLHPHPLDWLHLESAYETVIGKRKDDTPLPLIPANSWTNTLSVEVANSRYFVTLQNVFEQDRVSEFETTTPSYALLSLGASKVFKVLENDLSLSIAATNLTNKKYISHLSRLKQDNILNIGRNIKFGISYMF